MDQCSFAFRCIADEWNDNYDQRDIYEVSLDRGDVSICNYGANSNTSVVARSRRTISAAQMRTLMLRIEAGRRR